MKLLMTSQISLIFVSLFFPFRLFRLNRLVISSLFLTDIVKQLAGKFGLNLKSAYNSTRGFHLQLTGTNKEPAPPIETLPGVFIKVTKFKGTLSFTTSDLVSTMFLSEKKMRSFKRKNNVET